MPPVQDHHPRNHAQHNPGYPKCKESSTEVERTHKVTVSSHRCSPRHPQSTSHTPNTSRDNLAHAVAPAYPLCSSRRAAMKVAAPKDIESASSLSTLLSETSPPRPTFSKSNPHKVRRGKSKRLQLGRRKSTGTVVQTFSWKPKSPSSSLPRPIPCVSILPPTPEASQTQTTPSRAPQIDIIPPTPEARQSLPQFCGVPSVNVLPPTRVPSNQLLWPSKGQHLEAPPSRPFQKALEKRPAVESFDHLQLTSYLQANPKKLLGTYNGPPYQPFTSTTHSAGHKSPLQRHASFINLKDCWRTPEAELTARALRRWSSGNLPASRGMRKRFLSAQEASSAQDEAGEDDEAHEQTPLLAGVQAASEDTLEDDVNATTHLESDIESEPGATSRLRFIFSTVFFPFIIVYTCIASAVTTYLHDRDAHCGALGSHDTETARWLRRMDNAFPVIRGSGSQRSFGSFSSLFGSPRVAHNRSGSRGSMGSIPTVSSHVRKGSRGSIAPEEMRGVFGVVRWGNGIGEEYDPC